MTRKINPEWWDSGAFAGQPVPDLLATRDIAGVFNFLHAQGWSWAAIAQATDMPSASRVIEIARGRRRVGDYDVFVRIAEGLGIPRSRMGLGYDNQPTPAALPEKIDHRELLGAVASITVNSIPSDITRLLPTPAAVTLPAAITEQDVATIRAVTWLHRQLDVAAGGGTTLNSATGYISWATQLLHVPAASDHIARELRIALAELHSLVGWASHDINQHDTARRHLAQALVLARETGALQLAANVLYRLGRVSLHERDADSALHLFGLGQIVAQQARCPASTAILHSNTAWAYALLGAADQVRESLRRARGEMAHAHPDSAPAWTRFAFADADPHGLAAVIYTALARHPEHRGYAETALAEALTAVQLRQPEDLRSLAFDHISAATASFLVDDYDQAAAGATHAVALIDKVRSARVRDRLLDMWQLAAPAADLHPGLQRLGQQLAVV